MKKWTYKTNESVYLKMRLSTYPYIEDMIQRCKNEIYAIDLKISNFKSSSNYPPTGVPNDNPSENKDLKYDLMEQKKPWEERLHQLEYEKAELDGIILDIHNPIERNMIKDVYINCHSNSKIKNDYGFENEEYIYKKIDMILKKVNVYKG